MSAVPRVVLVTRPSEYAALLARHGTREQARFFLARRDQAIEPIEARHHQQEDAIAEVARAIPLAWRRARFLRADLARAPFEPDDVVVALGPDGLVANVAKYLDGQLVIGVDPAPGENAGVLVRHSPTALRDLLPAAARGRVAVEERAMVEATLDDGQRLRALNEIFVGHASHQSARYRLSVGGREERQSSSGVIVATGTGATGWAASIGRERAASPTPPGVCEQALVYFVREAWPGPTTGTGLTQGRLAAGDRLRLRCELEAGGVLFGDGIESDRVELGFGVEVAIGLAERRLRLVA